MQVSNAASETPLYQYDDILLKNLPDNVLDSIKRYYFVEQKRKRESSFSLNPLRLFMTQEQKNQANKEALPTFEVTTFVSEEGKKYLLDERLTYSGCILDTKFLDSHYAKRMFNPMDSLYSFKQTVIKGPAPERENDFLVLTDHPPLRLQKYKKREEGNGTQRKKMELYHASVNTAMNSTYIYYDDSKDAVENRTVQNILFACNQDRSGGGGYTLDQYLKDLEQQIQIFEKLVENKIKDCMGLVQGIHDELYKTVEKGKLYKSVEAGLTEIRAEKAREKLLRARIGDVESNIDFVQKEYDDLLTKNEDAMILYQTEIHLSELKVLLAKESKVLENYFQAFEALQKLVISNALKLEGKVKLKLDPILVEIRRHTNNTLFNMPFFDSMIHFPSIVQIIKEGDTVRVGCDSSFVTVPFENFLLLVKDNVPARFANC